MLLTLQQNGNPRLPFRWLAIPNFQSSNFHKDTDGLAQPRHFKFNLAENYGWQMSFLLRFGKEPAQRRKTCETIFLPKHQPHRTNYPTRDRMWFYARRLMVVSSRFQMVGDLVVSHRRFCLVRGCPWLVSYAGLWSQNEVVIHRFCWLQFAWNSEFFLCKTPWFLRSRRSVF